VKKKRLERRETYVEAENKGERKREIWLEK
jgi:hypothetical protein